MFKKKSMEILPSYLNSAYPLASVEFFPFLTCQQSNQSLSFCKRKKKKKKKKEKKHRLKLVQNNEQQWFVYIYICSWLLLLTAKLVSSAAFYNQNDYHGYIFRTNQTSPVVNSSGRSHARVCSLRCTNNKDKKQKQSHQLWIGALYQSKPVKCCTNYNTHV